jgi:glycine/D-amino acid oxidase-like deaminating enzyme
MSALEQEKTGFHPDVVVVGAGLVGAACAAELALGGAEVLVLDSHHAGGGTTAAGMGHVVAMDDSPAQLALCRYSQLLWQELLKELPAAAEYDPCGTLWVAADDEEMAAVAGKVEIYRAAGIPAEILDEAALREAEPQLRPGLAGGLRVPEDGVVYPPVVVDALLERARRAARSRGKRFAVVTGQRVDKIGRGEVRLADGSKIASSFVVDAAGIAALEILPCEVAGAAILPRKGHLVITERAPGFVRHQLVELGYLKSAHGSTADSVAFNLQPRATGQVLIGSSRQFGRRDAEVEPAMIARMLERAFSFTPALRSVPVLRAWTGLRPACPDHLPLIGALSEYPEILLAAGHEGLGITTSLGTARLIADAIFGLPSAIDPKPYLPERAGHGH